MNNKVTLQDLAEQLSNISGQSKKLSETFLRSLTEIIEEALEKDGIAKVKGLGTFKIIAIEERKSVSVTDGSAVMIPAHKKITFTPEKELKEAINKPYEHLETYILPTDGPVDAPVTDDEEEEGYVEEEIAAAAAGAAPAISSTVIGEALSNEVKAASSDPISSIEAITTKEEPTNIDVALEEEKETEEPTQEIETTTEVAAETTATETPADKIPADNVAEEVITEELPKQEEVLPEEVSDAETSSATTSEVAKEASEEHTEPMAANAENPTPTAEPQPTEPQQAEKKKGKKGLLVVIIILILLLLACLFYAHTQNPNVSSKLNDIKEQITQLFKGDESTAPTVTPAIVDTTPALSEAANNEQSEAFFEENEDEAIVEAAENEEIAQEPIKEVNYDWFEAEFKKFMKREHPKIKVEVIGEPTIDTIKAGKTLTSMSRKYYNGGKDFWVYIYLYNKDVIRRPDDVPAGKVIKIPQLHPSMVNPSSHESVNAAKDVKESYLRLFN